MLYKNVSKILLNSKITSTRRSNVTLLRRVDVIFEFNKILLKAEYTK